MRLSLSTNWCNRRIESGEEIADKALELGFGELELGFHTTLFQVKGFKARLGQIPVGSIHAFCPVPISAPQGYPELYQLASFDEEDRKMAALQVSRNVVFAAEMGADTVVLHAGRVGFGAFFDRIDSMTLRETLGKCDNHVDGKPYAKMLARAGKRRRKHGREMLDVAKRALDGLVPLLEKHHVTLAIENLPYLEGFPAEGELKELLAAFAGAPVRGWFDTGHARVRQMHGWNALDFADAAALDASCFAGMHLNDVRAFEDDHFAPGDGNVDFASLKPLAEGVGHVVFEPNAGVSEQALRKGVEHIRQVWNV